MATSTEDYGQQYQQACTAYAQGKYEEAASLVDQAVEHVPGNPNIHLLRGHVYYVLQQFDIARQEYQTVLDLTADPELITFANNGIDYINQYQQQDGATLPSSADSQPLDSASFLEDFGNSHSDVEDFGVFSDFDPNSFDFNSFASAHEGSGEEEPTFGSGFGSAHDSAPLNDNSADMSGTFGNPFAETPPAENNNAYRWDWQEDVNQTNPAISGNGNYPTGSDDSGDHLPSAWGYSQESTYEQPDSEVSESLPADDVDNVRFNRQGDDETLLMSDELGDSGADISFGFGSSPSWGGTGNNFSPTEAEISNMPSVQRFREEDSFDFDTFDSAFGDSTGVMEEASTNAPSTPTASNIEFLDDFDDFDDLGSIPGFELSEDSSFGTGGMNSGPLGQNLGKSPTSNVVYDRSSDDGSDREDELFSITGSADAVPAFTQTDSIRGEPQVNVEQGWLAPLENATWQTKQWINAGAVGIVSALAVAIVSYGATNLAAPQQREGVLKTGGLMALAALVAGGATSSIMSKLTMRQIRRTTEDLQAQFDAVREGNLNAQATVYSSDEFGQLATRFNEMSRVILTTTSEAQRKAQEQEEAKENLQRQVIRLLDDVEGAARGDLTVQAEVTADVLGAVADAFNLTIQNLRDIVQQVKMAAREVSRGATNSETFARALSSDALRQAEELAVTLNSVQVMTDSIQRVAVAAKEAESVARDASAIALKGGEAVERTVAGILEVRETVAETTRKVKRLAESSQEISKIVALISQIASRTNLLALNASIEAARAGEAGRGFAIVADEVRQLADKSAKSLKEIEQIVMQIQSETGSVMTAMEEGTQQVIKGTHLAEQAKRSLEDIIQVANRIDSLVRSITTNTVEQTETSRAVASVMQAVELTAQETSQEAQRVSGALQSLVGVSRDLLASVERFRVETTESR